MILYLKDINKILGIGIHQGKNLKYFSEYFPKSMIYGFDILDFSHLNSEKIHTFIGNQESSEELIKFIETCGSNFDLILDNGGGSMKQQQTSFGFLFQHLNPGGFYIIQDLQTSKMHEYKTENDSITTLDMLTIFQITDRITSNHIEMGNIRFLENHIESIEICGNLSNLSGEITSIIKKK